MFDVFKTLKIEEWKNATKEGDVKVNYDKSIAKNTVVIGGVTSASNYVSIPSSKGGASQSLGLVGKFVSFKSILHLPACSLSVARKLKSTQIHLN